MYTITRFAANDKGHDLAILQVSALGVQPLPLGDSDAVEIGDTVYTAGNPGRLEGTFSDGLISAIRPEGNELIHGKLLQMTAPISAGSSGGPVLNDSSEVIGISVGFREEGQNLNYAIPVNYLKAMIKSRLGVSETDHTKSHSKKN